MLRLLLVILMLVATTAVARPAEPAQLEILRTVDGGDQAMLYRPWAVCFAPDGGFFVLNAGDCRVLRFDADWRFVRAFGRQGSGPGEFTNPTGMLRRGDALWVFEMMRVTVFGLDGEYRRTLTSRVEMHAPLLTDRGLLVRLGSSDRLAALLDDQLGLVEKLGPACPTDGDWATRYRACGFVRALAHPDHLALMLNPYDGHLWALDTGGRVARELDLVDRGGTSRVRQQDDDSVSMSFTLVMGPGGVDRHGRLWTAPLPPDPGGERAQTLVVRGRDLAPLAEFTLPQGVHAFEVFHAPGGELVLTDAEASLIHVAAYPGGLGARPAVSP
jgi:hypothetical protein